MMTGFFNYRFDPVNRVGSFPPSADLDKDCREIAWKAVVEHPFSGVADENQNGIGDHLE